MMTVYGAIVGISNSQETDEHISDERIDVEDLLDMRDIASVGPLNTLLKGVKKVLWENNLEADAVYRSIEIALGDVDPKVTITEVDVTYEAVSSGRATFPTGRQWTTGHTWSFGTEDEHESLSEEMQDRLDDEIDQGRLGRDYEEAERALEDDEDWEEDIDFEDEDEDEDEDEEFEDDIDDYDLDDEHVVYDW